MSNGHRTACPACGLPGLVDPTPPRKGSKPVVEVIRVKRVTGWTHHCLRCGAAFESKRRDAAACSSACRRAITRARV